MGNEITVYNEGGNTLADYARGIESKVAVCEMLLKSQVLPKALNSPQAIMAVILMGQEYGFAPMISCHMFDFIQGRATMRAAALAALCIKEGGAFHVISNTATSCKIRAVRPSKKWEETFEFTIEMAKRMGLAGKDNWQKHPEAMLYARCISVLARRGWADVLGGLLSSEEMEDSDEFVEVKAVYPPDLAPKVEPTPVPTWYAIPEPTREQRLFLEKRGCTWDEVSGTWACPMDLGKKLEMFRVDHPPVEVADATEGEAA